MTKTFNDDQSDKLPFKVASGIAEMDNETTAPQLDIQANGFDVDGFQAQLSNAVASLKDAHVRPEEIDYDTGEMFGAAFRQGNMVGSAASSQGLREQLFPTPNSKELTDDELLARINADGLGALSDNFKDVFTEAEYDARKNDISRELEDRKILEASGFSGMAALMAAGVLDLPTLVPVGRAVQLSKIASPSLKTAAEVSIASGLSAAAAEAALQQTQVTRSIGESAMAVGSATLLGGVLGFGVAKAIGPDLAAKSVAKVDALRKDAETGFAGAKSAGAAAVTQVEAQIARNLDGTDRVFSGGAFEVIDGLGKAPGFVGQNLRTPRMELERGVTAAERKFMGQMAYNPSISVKEAEAANLLTTGTDGAVASKMRGASVGAEAPKNVETVVTEFQGNFVETVYQGEKLYRKNKANYSSFDDFGERVTLAMVEGDRSADPIVQQFAKIARDRVFNKIADTHVANGNFAEELRPRNATSYFPLIHDADAIRANKDEWTEYMTASFKREIDEDFRQAQVEKSGRASDKADMKIAANKAAAEDKAQIRAEHEANIKALRETRQKEVEKFEADKAADLDDLKAKHDEKLQALRDSRDEMLQGEHPQGRAEISKAKIKASYAEAKGRAAANYVRDRSRLARKHQIARDRLKNKFDKQEEKAREARDKAEEAALTEAMATLTKAKELSLTDGLSILKKANTPEKRAALAAQRAEAMYLNVTGGKRFILDHEVGGGSGDYAKFRSNPAFHADLIARKWVKTNVFDIMEHYTRTAGVDAAIGTIFKKTVMEAGEDGVKVPKIVGDVTLSEVKKNITREYDDLIGGVRSQQQESLTAQISKLKESGKAKPGEIEALEAARDAAGTARSKEEVALINQRARALENVDMIQRFAHGQSFGDSTSQSFANAAELMGAFNFLRLMGGTVASSLGDPINITIANGFGNTMKYGITPMLKNFKEAIRNADSDTLRLSRLANANTEIVLNSTVLALADIGNTFAKATPIVSFARNASKIFSKATGITYWNALWKQVATNTTRGRLVQNAVQGWQGVSRVERAWMLNLGINEASLARIRTAFETQAGSKWVDGTDLPIPRFDEWADKEMGALFRGALGAEAHNNVITPHYTDKLAMSGNPVGQNILQFRRFMFSQQARVIGRNIQLASIDEAGGKRASVATALFGLAMMGAIVDATKQTLGSTTITGGNIRANQGALDHVISEWENNPGSALYNSLDRAAFFPIVFEGNNMLEKLGLPNLRGGMSRAFGDEKAGESSRFKNRGVFESVFGPSVGLMEDTAKLGSFMTGYADSYLGSGEAPNFNRSDFRKFKRMTIGGNAPVVQQIVNEGEKYMGNIFDWPEPK